jgi:hypothetical protein
VTPDVRYDVVKGHVTVTVGEDLPLEVFRETMQRLTSSKDFPPSTSTIWDLRRLDPAVLTEPYLRQVVEIRASFGARYRTRVAHVADSPLAYGMLRMYEALSEVGDAIPERHFAVFRTMEEAEAWLSETATFP